MRVLLLLLLSLFMLSAFSADNLLRWHDAQHYTVQASTSLKAKRAWKLCALYPSLKDSYWLSLNYGMQEAARRYGVDLKVLEAGGYSQLATQQAQIDQCKQWGAEAILLGSSTTSFPDLQKQVANLPVIELVNAIDAPQVKSRVGVPWFQMGYQPGRYLVQWAHGKPLNVLLMPGPDNAGGSKEMVEGFRAAIAGSPVRIVDIALGDNDIEIQRNLLQEDAGTPSRNRRRCRNGHCGRGGNGGRAQPENAAYRGVVLSFTSGVSRVEAGKSDYGSQRSNGLAGGTGG